MSEKVLSEGEADAIKQSAIRLELVFQRPWQTDDLSTSVAAGRPCPKGVRFLSDREKEAINNSGRNLERAFGLGEEVGDARS